MVGFPDIMGETGKCSDDRQRVVFPVSSSIGNIQSSIGRKVHKRKVALDLRVVIVPTPKHDTVVSCLSLSEYGTIVFRA